MPDAPSLSTNTPAPIANAPAPIAEDPIPNVAPARRKLQFIFLADCSGSMLAANKIQSLNHAIREAIPHMQDSARANPQAEVMVRSIRFSSGASWHQAQPTPVEQYSWVDLQADGSTDMAGALVLAKQALDQLQGRQYPPVLCLITDGMPDSVSEFQKRLAELKDSPWGSRAVRIVIGIGAEASTPPGLTVLQEFLGNIELPVLTAAHAQDLVNYIRYVSTVVVQNVSRPPSVPQGPGSAGAPNNVVVAPAAPKPTPPPPADMPW